MLAESVGQAIEQAPGILQVAHEGLDLVVERLQQLGVARRDGLADVRHVGSGWGVAARVLLGDVVALHLHLHGHPAEVRSQFVNWCLEPSQQRGILAGLTPRRS